MENQTLQIANDKLVATPMMDAVINMMDENIRSKTPLTPEYQLHCVERLTAIRNLLATYEQLAILTEQHIQEADNRLLLAMKQKGSIQ